MAVANKSGGKRIKALYTDEAERMSMCYPVRSCWMLHIAYACCTARALTILDLPEAASTVFPMDSLSILGDERVGIILQSTSAGHLASLLRKSTRSRRLPARFV